MARGVPAGDLLLNGDTVRLGSVGDVRSQTAEGEVFRIAVRDELRELAWEFTGERRAQMAGFQAGTLTLLNGGTVKQLRDVAHAVWLTSRDVVDVVFQVLRLVELCCSPSRVLDIGEIKPLIRASIHP